MKIFKKDYKVNFVDKSDCFVGFDFEDYCCEHYGFYFSDSQDTKYDYMVYDDEEQDDFDRDLDGFFFDKSFFVEHSGGMFDSGGEAVFRLVKGEEELFLHLFNHHNGYYGHGFHFNDGKLFIKRGCL